MAGSMTNNAVLYKKKTFTFMPPTPPADLIDCSNFRIVETAVQKSAEMIVFIKNLRNDLITTNPNLNFVSQLKMYATSQLVERWAQRWSGEMSPELFTESEMRLISSPRYSSMSPMHEDLSQRSDKECGIDEFLTQATWAPIRKTKSLPNDISIPSISQTIIDKRQRRNSDNFAQYPQWYTSPKYINSSPTTIVVDENDEPINMSINEPASLPPAIIDNFTQYPHNRIKSSPTSPAVDENDGPTSFNHSPSTLDFTGGKPMQKLNKQNVKRKLFV